MHASWADLGTLRDTYGWTFYSGGARHANMTTMTAAQQLNESCGSLPVLESHGHTRGWGLFGYGNDKYTTQIQANVVSTCFSYGRRYVGATTPASIAKERVDILFIDQPSLACAARPNGFADWRQAWFLPGSAGEGTHAKHGGGV